MRLGFGIYHDSSWNQGAQGLWQNPPNLWRIRYIQHWLRLRVFILPRHARQSVAFAPATTTGGFPLLPTPQDVTSFEGTYVYQPTNFQPGRFTNITRTSNGSCREMFCSPPATPVRSAAICW